MKITAESLEQYTYIQNLVKELGESIQDKIENVEPVFMGYNVFLKDIYSSNSKVIYLPQNLKIAYMEIECGKNVIIFENKLRLYIDLNKYKLYFR